MFDTTSCKAQRSGGIDKAGLLAPLPFQRPSHFAQAKQWHTLTEKVLYPGQPEKSRATAAGPLPILTGFPIKLSHLKVFLNEKNVFLSSEMIGTIGRYLNGNTVFFFNKLQIIDRIIIFGLAVTIIIEFDFRDIELNQAP